MTEIDMSGYITLVEYAKDHNLTKQRISQLVKRGKIDAIKDGRSVLIPKNAEIKRFSNYEPAPEGYISVADFAEKLRVSPGAVRYWIRNGHIENVIHSKHRTYVKEGQSRPILKRGRNSLNKNHKTRVLSIWLTLEQANSIREQAERDGLNVSEFIRKELGFE